MNSSGFRKKALVFVVLLLTMFFPFVAARADEPAPAAPEAPKPSFSLSADILNQYCFRGFAQSKGSAVIQPGFTASYNGFSASIWGNFDTSRHNENPIMTLLGQSNNPAAPGQKVGNAKWTETDVTVSYTKEICPNFSINLGNIYYGLQQPISSFDQDELYGGVSYNFPWVSVAFTVYGEVTHASDVYFELDFSKSIPVDCLCKGATVDLLAGFSYLLLPQDSNVLSLDGVIPSSFSPDSPQANAVNTGSYSAFHTAELSADIKFPIGKYLAISPKIAVWLPLTDSAEDLLQANSMDTKSVHVVGGINLTGTF